MHTATSTAATARAELGAGFAGELIGPADAGYEAHRRVYNAWIDRRPALIARCAGPDDVARTIAAARRTGLPLAVRGGGHHGRGLGVVDDGIVCDLSPLREIAVDPETRTAVVGGGCTWGEVDRATHEHGLAVPSGIISTTGVTGLTLGGGHGYLSRRYGLTIDSLLEAEVVLASGERVRAAADEHPELFWAIRGGGGNFGVVTALRFRLHPVATVVGGPTMWPLEQAGEVIRRYRELMAEAPRDLSGFLGLQTVPPAPAFPPALHLRKVVLVMWCCLRREAEAASASLRELGPPLVDGVGELPYPALQSAFDALMPPGLQWYWHHDFVRELPDAAIEQHVAFAERSPSVLSGMHLYPVDGAVHDVGASDTAFAFRDARWSQGIVGVDPDPDRRDALRGWAVEYGRALAPWSAGGGYVNMTMDAGAQRVRDSYRGNYERLTRVKAAYDPENVFRLNQNIPPAG